MTTHSILKFGGVAAVALMLGGTGALAQSQPDVATGGRRLACDTAAAVR